MKKRSSEKEAKRQKRISLREAKKALLLEKKAARAENRELKKTIRKEKQAKRRDNFRKKPILVRIAAFLFLFCLSVGILGGAFLSVTNIIMLSASKGRIYEGGEISAEGLEYDAIIVLGAGVRDDGSPSHMLEDRLKAAYTAYMARPVHILVTGDHSREGYNEVGAMKDYLIEKGVPSEDIFMDHAGFSTYESAYRAKEIFSISSALVVTQEYHLHRAIYLCRSLGIDAYGYSASLRSYYGQFIRDAREIVARGKDSLYILFMPSPTYLGEKIDFSGNGDITND